MFCSNIVMVHMIRNV